MQNAPGSMIRVGAHPTVYCTASRLAPMTTVPMVNQRGLAPWQVKLLSTYISAHLESKITTKQLASMSRLSPFYFARAFKMSFGDSPHRYVLQRRMERSQGLMLKTSASLADIALDCGLVDQAHLGKVFRRLVGESPAAWRRARSDTREPDSLRHIAV
jgi:AraC family transcriptional regulator